MEWKQIEEVNEKLKKVDIKGKKYAMVKDKVLGLRAIEPNATIDTEILHYNGEVVIIKATVLVDGVQLGSGIAEEKSGSTTINKTSFVENCETSAIGRALSSMGIGAEDSYASGEEVATAMLNQTDKPKKKDNFADADEHLEEYREALKGLLETLKKMGAYDKFWNEVKTMFNVETVDDLDTTNTIEVGKLARKRVEDVAEKLKKKGEEGAKE